MLFPKSSESDLKLYRILLLVGGAAYFFFWFILKSVEPDCYDPILGRAIVSVAIIIVFSLTFTSQFVRDYVVMAAYLIAYLLTFYYVFLLSRNFFSYTYSIGMMTIV